MIAQLKTQLFAAQTAQHREGKRRQHWRGSPRAVQPHPAAGGGRRRLLFGAGAAAAWLLLERPAGAGGLRSVASQAPSVITFRNELDHPVKVYWINYSGDAEFYAALPPAGWWTVDTYESHPWRVVDPSNGQVLHEVVTPAGATLVRIDPLMVPQPSPPAANEAPAVEFVGWDGVGGTEAEYVRASVAEIGLDHLGGVALVQAEGFPLPVPISVGMNDAAQLFHAAGPEFRRPSTMALWVRSLQAAGATVDRVLVTRLVGSTVYARIILSLPGGELRSLDARPSDSLALAMQTNAPIFIGRRLAASQQPGAPEVEAGDWSSQLPPSPSRQGSPPTSAQASYAHSRKA